MHETVEDIRALQELLDRSYAAAGPHLRGIIIPERRIGALQASELLTGMCMLALATVTADCRPMVAPLDGVFYRGAFHFGTSPGSVRVRHIGARPQVSATHAPREELAVTVHGRAVPVDIGAEQGAGLRQTLLEVYVPRYGPQWEEFLEGGTGGPEPPRPPVYYRIEAERMFTFRMQAGL